MRKTLHLLIHCSISIAILVGLASPTGSASLARAAQTALQAPLATYTVSNTNDSGAGSLRQAILDANANPGADTLIFAIGDPGTQQTIQPLSALPAISDPVTVDGWSRGGACPRFAGWKGCGSARLTPKPARSMASPGKGGAMTSRIGTAATR